MSDVDDELLALVGGSGSSSPGHHKRATKRQRRRREDVDSDISEDDVDAEGSNDNDDDSEDNDDDGLESGGGNPFPLDGLYKDEEDRERLSKIPELEREDELAARRDLITKRRQKADLRAMLRSQQMAGKKQRSTSSAQPAKRKAKRLKKATAKPRRRKADSDNEEEEEDGELSSDISEEEEEESDYESTRHSTRSRKPTGKTSAKAAQLQKLKRSRAKAQRRRAGADSDEEGSADETEESEYDEEEAEAFWRQKKERERIARGGAASKRGTTAAKEKPSREQERVSKRLPWSLSTLSDVNAARIRRDHFTRIIHRPGWTNELIGKFARVNTNLRDPATGRMMTKYRLVQIIDVHEAKNERYYQCGEQLYTQFVCDLQCGEEKLRDFPLAFFSNSDVSQEEHEEWQRRIEAIESKSKQQRTVPSHEATLDQAENLESFINRPFTEQDINQVLKDKREAREAFEMQQKARHRPTANARIGNGHASAPMAANVALNNEQVMAQMNEKNRRAERDRIAEAERRTALQAKLAAQKIISSSQRNTPHGTPPPGSQNGTDSPSRAKVEMNTVKLEDKLFRQQQQQQQQHHQQASALAAAAVDVDIELGDF